MYFFPFIFLFFIIQSYSQLAMAFGKEDDGQMDEWLRLGFSAELRLTVTALRKRKTELSNFDAYYTISAPPHTAVPPPPVRRLVGGGLEKCQHQLNVTHSLGEWLDHIITQGLEIMSDKKQTRNHVTYMVNCLCGGGAAWQRMAAVTLLSALIHDALRRLNIRFQFTSKLKAMTPDRRQRSQGRFWKTLSLQMTTGTIMLRLSVSSREKAKM